VWLRSMSGDLGAARTLLATPPIAWRTHAGLVHEARCDTVLAAGAWDEAAAVAAMVRRHAVEAPSPVTGAFADRLDGAGAVGRGEVDAGVGLLERALQTFDECEAPWEAARTRLLLAAALRRAGRTADADTARDQAQEVLERLGIVEDGIIDRALAAMTGG